MFRIAAIVPVALAAWVGSAVAADCLTQIDGLTVEYDLPAGPSLTPEAAQLDQQALSPQPVESNPGAVRTSPAGRPGYGRLTSPTGGEAPMLPQRSRLSSAQRNRVMGVLNQARAAEANGQEAECLGFLKEAQAIVKAPPETAKRRAK